ncbi:carboxypeptidase M32 [Rhodovulum adriaticum]|uniref:Metal-dependent carboxypeptidase n=1 Tax=Rhodovulum adriaticum TaxID=35804 RepID=A0A4R2NVY2_RHOAD|nr:carboxypeptidase M32 [Rhodovulum adriaticum]MBK1635642.1 carboxypeptidase M32 [Rhodovulum adriaticum]TCP26122.1 carboxypeptidase Taq [Rhodovulum adriaticum]
MGAYDDLIAYERETQALAQVMGRLSWDQETVMPKGAAHQRAEEMGALESVLHRRRTDPRVGEWLEAVDETALDHAARAQLRHILRGYIRAMRLPETLSSQIARVTSRAQGIWAEARAADDVAHFLPTLAEVVRLKREEAAALAQGGDPYDALLDDYEPGATGAGIAAMFDRMRPRLVELRERILGSDRHPAPLSGRFGAEGQMTVAREVASHFGYDWRHGRLDHSVHPFTSGSGTDVRITTRVDEGDPLNCLYSTLHEVGHGAYEQGIDPAYLLSPLGEGVSMGVHESQSRIYENQLGRSRAFCGWLHARLAEVFGQSGAADADAFYAAVNRVHSGYIRTEADEVHYNLHIMLRFDLERELIAGRLEVADLEEAWNERFQSDFGVAVDKPSNGVLQDVHWSVGLFGYFPTYTLGNVYAGCLYTALCAAVPSLDDDLARGHAETATAWLRENVQRHGGLYEPAEVIQRACGFDPHEGPLLDYLEAKFGALYRL